MRVVLTIDFSPWSAYGGGAQRSTHRLATELSRRGHEVHAVFTKPPHERVEVPALEYRHHWAVLPALASRRGAVLRPTSGLFVAATVARLDARAPVDVVHAQGEEGAWLDRLPGRRRIRLVSTPRHPRYPAGMYSPPRGLGTTAGLALRESKYLLQERASRIADQVAVASRFTARQVARTFGLRRDAIAVVPNGVDSVYTEVEREPGAADGPVVFWGRLEPDKGLRELLRAWSRLPDDLRGGRRLIVVGRGSLRDEALATPHVAVRPWAEPAELARLLSTASLAALPSHHESFGNTIAEALVSGTPVLTSDAEALTELVEHEQRGLCVPRNDPAALETGLRRLLGDARLRERLGAAGRTWARGRLTWSACAEAYERLYGPTGAP